MKNQLIILMNLILVNAFTELFVDKKEIKNKKNR